MKKLSALIIGLSFALPLAASAATFSVSPSSGSYNTGDTVTLNVSVNPAGSTIYTAMLDARFSPANFDVVSFTLNDALLPLKQSGYDALDNANGVLTKTGGFTGGITSTASFGTIVLRAKSAGTATFAVADSSKLLDANNADQQSGTQTNSYTIITKTTPTPEPTKTTPTPAKTVTTTKTPTADNSAAVVNSQQDTQPLVAEASSTQTAAVAGAGFGTSSGAIFWLLELIGAAVMFGIGYFVGKRRVL